MKKYTGHRIGVNNDIKYNMMDKETEGNASKEATRGAHLSIVMRNYITCLSGRHGNNSFKIVTGRSYEKVALFFN